MRLNVMKWFARIIGLRILELNYVIEGSNMVKCDGAYAICTSDGVKYSHRKEGWGGGRG